MLSTPSNSCRKYCTSTNSVKTLYVQHSMEEVLSIRCEHIVLPRLDPLHSRLASSLVIPFAHHHVCASQLLNTKLPEKIKHQISSLVTKILYFPNVHSQHWTKSTIKERDRQNLVLIARWLMHNNQRNNPESTRDFKDSFYFLIQDCCYFHCYLVLGKFPMTIGALGRHTSA